MNIAFSKYVGQISLNQIPKKYDTWVVKIPPTLVRDFSRNERSTPRIKIDTVHVPSKPALNYKPL